MLKARPVSKNHSRGSANGQSYADVVVVDHVAERRRLRYAAERAARLASEAGQTPSLPTVSILRSDIDLEPADFYAGRQALREAGL